MWDFIKISQRNVKALDDQIGGIVSLISSRSPLLEESDKVHFSIAFLELNSSSHKSQSQ